MLNPIVERVILNMPSGMTKPVNPALRGRRPFHRFAGTPAAGGRAEIYQIDVDGTDRLTCALPPTFATTRRCDEH